MRSSGPSLSLLLLSCALLFLEPLPGRAQPGEPELRGQLATLVGEANLGDRVGIVVTDVASGEILFEHRGDLPLNPASNQKLVTAATALLTVGPDFQIPTGLYGRIDEDGVVPVLVIKGNGDPSLRMSDLVELASMAAERGIERIQSIHVDGSYFDDQRLPPAFEQQPDEMAAFRAAVGAVVVERSSYLLRVVPGEVGTRPAIRLAASGYFEVDNQLTTSEDGTTNVVVVQREREDGRLDLRVTGSVPAGSDGVSYRRRVENPLLHAGHALADAFSRLGIDVEGVVTLGSAEGLPLLAQRLSEPISQLLYRVGKWSDNFVAEMILKIIGAEDSRPGTSAGGVAVLRRILEAAGGNLERIELVNGSGLFEGNRIAAHDLVALLRHVHGNAAVREEYLAQLAVGGGDGTLERRFRDLPAPRIVRAKTGTLDDVIALSGYVIGPSPDRVVAFSVIANGVRGKQAEARQLCDRVVAAIADHLY